MTMPTPGSWNTAIVQAAAMLVACMALFGLVYRLFRQELLDQMTDIKLRLRRRDPRTHQHSIPIEKKQ
jgi:hypothetical protein